MYPNIDFVSICPARVACSKQTLSISRCLSIAKEIALLSLISERGFLSFLPLTLTPKAVMLVPTVVINVNPGEDEIFSR